VIGWIIIALIIAGFIIFIVTLLRIGREKP